MTNALLQHGIAALRAGDKAKARQLLAGAIQKEPHNAQAWLWLSGAVNNDKERLECLNRALAIDPNNKSAQRGLAALRQDQAIRPTEVKVPQAERRTPPESDVAQPTPEIIQEQTSMPTCAACGAEILAGQKVVVRGKDKKASPKIICTNCAAALEKAFRAETENPNLVGAIGLGFGAATISALVWYLFVILTHYQLGFVAVGVGFLIGLAVILGSGGKRGTILQLISAAITLLTMGISEYLIVRHFSVQALAEEGYTGIPLVLPVNLAMNVIAEGIKSNPLTLLFWGIAAWEAFAIPGKRRLRRA
jgi:tetratricopeptide (TPR) repeat protein